MKKIIFGFSFLILLIQHNFAFSYDAALKRALELGYNGQFAEAESTINSYINGHPNDSIGYVIRANITDWKQKLQGTKLDSKVLADLEGANKLAFAAWDKDQKNVDKMIDLGNTYLFLSKKWLDLGKKSRSGMILKKAHKHMDEAMKIAPNRYDAYLAAGVFNFFADNIPSGLSIIATLLGISGDEAKGIEQLNAASTNDNLYQPHALLLKSYAYGQTKKNFVQAHAIMSQLATKYPGNSYFKRMKAEYSMRAKNYEQSTADFAAYFKQCESGTKACAPEDVFLAHVYNATNYIELKRSAEAKPFVDAAMKMGTTQYKDRIAKLYYFMGIMERDKGDKAKAKEYFEKALSSPGIKSEVRKMTLEGIKSL